MNICKIFGHQKLSRKYFPDRTTLKCPKCKKVADAEIYGTNICRDCKIEMKNPKMWDYKCEACGYNC